MHVAMVCSEFPPFGGGTASHVSGLAAALVRAGAEVSIVTRGHGGQAVTRQRHVTVYAPPCPPIYPYHARFHGLLVSRLLTRIGSSLDIVHLHSPLVFAPQTDLPIVTSVHGTVGGGLRATDANQAKSLLERALMHEFLRAEESAVMSADRILPISAACAAELRSTYNPKTAMNVVTNGVDIDFFKPNEESRERTPLILFVGRMVSQKGLDELVLAGSRIMKRWKDAVFVFAGSGRDSIRLQRKARSLGMDHNVRFIGQVNKEQLRDLYQRAWIFVLPSRYEGMPSAVLEALASGLPMVATNVGGVGEAVRDGYEGMLVCPRDSEALAVAMDSLLDSEDTRVRFGRAARERAVKCFAWDVITTKVQESYVKSLEQHPRSQSLARPLCS